MTEKAPCKKLFLPGPVWVHPEVLRAMSTPMIGHRGAEYRALHARVRENLKRLMMTEAHVFVSTSSGTGVMEAAVRNLVGKRVLSCVSGAFGERWHAIAKANGKEADALEVDWGKAIRPEMVDRSLSTGKYDALTLVHNESSTGVMNPLDEIARVVRKYPEVMFLVDTVSSLGGVQVAVDRLGIDLCLASVQKALGLPPGLAVLSVSRRALERASKIPCRGSYFDLVEFQKSDELDQTPNTPAIPHLFALDLQLDRIFREGLESRFRRHRSMAERCRQWACAHFEVFPEHPYESVTLTAVKNTRSTDIASLNRELGRREMEISDGYGKLKGLTFRIAHMGDCQPADLEELFGAIEEILGLR